MFMAIILSKGMFKGYQNWDVCCLIYFHIVLIAVLILEGFNKITEQLKFKTAYIYIYYIWIKWYISFKFEEQCIYNRLNPFLISVPFIIFTSNFIKFWENWEEFLLFHGTSDHRIPTIKDKGIWYSYRAFISLQNLGFIWKLILWIYYTFSWIALFGLFWPNFCYNQSNCFKNVFPLI